MGSLIICLCLNNRIYSDSNSSCTKMHLNVDVRMYGSVGPQCLSMRSPNFSQCLTSVYKAWSYLGARAISLPFDSQRIITVNVVFGNSGRLHLAVSPARSSKSVATHLWPRLTFSLASRFSLAHVFNHISTYCW
jgi:hypothetical protein